MEIINNNNPKLYEELKAKCKEHGITMEKLCEKANIPRATVSNWKKENPSTIQALLDIERVFDKIKEQKVLENEKLRNR